MKRNSSFRGAVFLLGGWLTCGYVAFLPTVNLTLPSTRGYLLSTRGYLLPTRGYPRSIHTDKALANLATPSRPHFH